MLFIVTRVFFLHVFVFYHEWASGKKPNSIFSFDFFHRDLQRSYLDVLTWLVRMESTITTDDSNVNTLTNDVLKKSSLLINVSEELNEEKKTIVCIVFFLRDYTMRIHYLIQWKRWLVFIQHWSYRSNHNVCSYFFDMRNWWKWLN